MVGPGPVFVETIFGRPLAPGKQNPVVAQGPERLQSPARVAGRRWPAPEFRCAKDIVTVLFDDLAAHVGQRARAAHPVLEE